MTPGSTVALCLMMTIGLSLWSECSSASVPHFDPDSEYEYFSQLLANAVHRHQMDSWMKWTKKLLLQDSVDDDHVSYSPMKSDWRPRSKKSNPGNRETDMHLVLPVSRNENGHEMTGLRKLRQLGGADSSIDYKLLRRLRSDPLLTETANYHQDSSIPNLYSALKKLLEAQNAF